MVEKGSRDQGKPGYAEGRGTPARGRQRAWMGLGTALAGLCVLAALLAYRAEGIPAWEALGTGLNGSVRALALSGDQLCAGGAFANAGGVSANRVALWNGSAWSALGAGLDNLVYALAVSGDQLYAGGDFANAGGVSANRVACWNGSAWAPLGTGLNGPVHALAILGGSLYAGGEFTETEDGTPLNYLARWDGSAWSSVGPDNGVIGPVFALAVSGSRLCVGGLFTHTGGSATELRNLAWWVPGSGTWEPLVAGGNTGVTGPVTALAVSGSSVYAGGQVAKIVGGVTANNIARWDGAAWHLLGTGDANGVNGQVLALAISGDTLYAGGAFTATGDGGAPLGHLARFDGTAWTDLGGDADGAVRALAVSGAGLYAAGDFTRVAGLAANRVAFRRGVDAPTPTPPPTSTPTPTLTPGPTSTPRPMPTSAPTPTVTPNPWVNHEYVELVPGYTHVPVLDLRRASLLLVPVNTVLSFGTPFQNRLTSILGDLRFTRKPSTDATFLTQESVLQYVTLSPRQTVDVVASLQVFAFSAFTGEPPSQAAGQNLGLRRDRGTAPVSTVGLLAKLPSWAARVRNLSLYAAVDGATARPFHLVTNAPALARDGTMAILDERGTFLGPDAPLDPSKTYQLLLSIRDNGPFDPDPAPGIALNASFLFLVADPSTSPSRGGGSGGCALVPAPGLAPWPVLLVLPALLLFRRKR